MLQPAADARAQIRECDPRGAGAGTRAGQDGAAAAGRGPLKAWAADRAPGHGRTRGSGHCGAGSSGPDGAGAHPPARLAGARRPLGPRQLRWAPGRAQGGCSRPASRAGSAPGVGSRTEEEGAPREKTAALPLSSVARGASQVKFGSFSPRVTSRIRGRPWGFPEPSLAVTATRRGWQRGGWFGFASAEGSPGRRGCARQDSPAPGPARTRAVAACPSGAHRGFR